MFEVGVVSAAAFEHHHPYQGRYELDEPLEQWTFHKEGAESDSAGFLSSKVACELKPFPCKLFHSSVASIAREGFVSSR